MLGLHDESAMRVGRFLLLLFLCCTVSALGVAWFAPPHNQTPQQREVEAEAELADAPAPPSARPAPNPNAAFQLEGPLRFAGRSSIDAASNDEFVLFEISTDEKAKSTAAGVNLALVMDRSGSMNGARIANAKCAAQAAIAALREGDYVVVVTFDTAAETVFHGRIDAASRLAAAHAIDKIALGGDTCVSCGVNEALKSMPSESGLKRIVLLSDGDANVGLRTLEDFRRLGQQAAREAVSITSVGLDVHYNERVLTALSEASNGRHIFSDRPEELSAVFAQEADRLAGSVADKTEVSFTLPPSVELVTVVDRAFTREGDAVRVTLGTLSRGERKTILVRVRGGRRAIDPRLFATLRYEDASTRRMVDSSSTLALATEGEVDAAVAERAARAQAAGALREANELMERGKFEAARATLGSARAAIAGTARAPAMAMALTSSSAVAADFNRQLETLERAENAVPRATPVGSAGDRSLRVQQKQNWTLSRALGF